VEGDRPSADHQELYLFVNERDEQVPEVIYESRRIVRQC
jgi:hypothetical protein